MIVKNYLVSDKEIYLEYLIKELIKYNISYVLIDNYEIHFTNYIIRLITKDELLSLFKNDIFTEILVTNSFKENKTKNKLDNKTVPKQNKKSIKDQNRNAMQKIKSYKR